MVAGPLLVSDRLELWRPTFADLQPMFEIMQDERTWRHFGAPIEMAEHSLRFFRNAGSWDLCGYGSFMVRRRGDSAVIGNCGIFHSWRGVGADFDDNPEAGWIIAADQAGQGFAGEAMEAALAWFDRQHGPRRMVALIAPDNAPSQKLAVRLGFTHMRQADFHGAPHDLFERLPG